MPVKLSHPSAATTLLFVVLCWANLLGQLHSYAITSKYIGAQNNGDEHVLLFQLPQMISSQLQQQQLQPKYASAASFQQAEPLSQQSSESSSFVYNQNPADQLGGQQISLTIPISTLTHKSSSLSGGGGGDQTTARQQFRFEPTQTSPQLIDYLLGEESVAQVDSSARPINQQQQQQQQTDSAVVTVHPSRLHEFSAEQIIQVSRHNNSRYQEQQQQDVIQSSQQQQRMANLTSTIEQHLKQILRQHQLEQQQQQQQQQYAQTEEPQYSTTDASLIAHTTIIPQYEQEQQPQPQLWRDTQQQQQQQQQQQHREPLSDTSASLLTRLANSSPELLLRLRSLLNRAARQSAATNYTMSDQVKSLYPSRLSEQLGQQQQQPEQSSEGLSSLARGLNNNTMLNTFLTSQNLSSHEEIKVPLVVIAMPRILSLKRNNLAASSFPKNSSSNGSSNLPPAPLASTDALNLIQQTVRSTLANLTQGREYSSPIDSGNGSGSGSNRTSQHQLAIGLSPSSSAVGQPLSTESILNATRDARLLSQIYSARNLYSQQQQELPTTTSSPPHTMAPYARQFHLPMAPSLVSRFNYVSRPSDAIEQHFVYQQQQPTTTIRFPQPQQNQSQFGPHQLSPPLIETILANHPSNNINASNLLLRQSLFNRPAAEHGAAAGFQIRLVNEGQQLANHQRVVYHEDVQQQQQRQQQQPHQYEIQIADDSPATRQHHAHHHYDDEQPAQERVYQLSSLAAARQQEQQQQQQQQRQRRHRSSVHLSNGNFTQDGAGLDYLTRPYPPQRLAPSDLEKSAQTNQFHFLNSRLQPIANSGRQALLLEEQIVRLRPLFRGVNSRADEVGQASELFETRQPLTQRRLGGIGGIASTQEGSKKSPKIMLMIV